VNTTLDHLVVGAASLEQGVQWCERVRGVTPGPGGRHARMGTHNRLLALSTEAFPQCYLEIIAIDPEAPRPPRPRWFGLDEPAVQAQLAASPRLIHAVARSPQLDMHRWGLVQSGVQPGEPLAMSRAAPAGELRWQILVRPDGALPLGGALPTLIQWRGRHPAQGMPDSGVTLQALTLRGVPTAAISVLRLLAVAVEAATDGPALQARLTPPRGGFRKVCTPSGSDQGNYLFFCKKKDQKQAFLELSRNKHESGSFQEAVSRGLIW